jgi:hypothetical protein
MAGPVRIGAGIVVVETAAVDKCNRPTHLIGAGEAILPGETLRCETLLYQVPLGLKLRNALQDIARRTKASIEADLSPESGHHLANEQLHIRRVWEQIEFDLEKVKAKLGKLLNALRDCGRIAGNRWLLLL